MTRRRGLTAEADLPQGGVAATGERGVGVELAVLATADQRVSVEQGVEPLAVPADLAEQAAGRVTGGEVPAAPGPEHVGGAQRGEIGPERVEVPRGRGGVGHQSLESLAHRHDRHISGTRSSRREVTDVQPRCADRAEMLDRRTAAGHNCSSCLHACPVGVHEPRMGARSACAGQA